MRNYYLREFSAFLNKKVNNITKINVFILLVKFADVCSWVYGTSLFEGVTQIIFLCLKQLNLIWFR